MSIIRSLVIVLLAFFFNFFLQLYGKPQTHITIRDTTHNHVVYIVHVQSPIGTKFHLFKHRKTWYKSFLPNATLDSGEPRLVYAYRTVISGFAAWLTKEELKAMKSMNGFLLAHRDGELELRTTYTPKFLGLSMNAGMWYNSEYGQGTIIAVIDSGVKPTHPSFRDQDMPPAPKRWNGTCYWTGAPPLCNNKIIGAQSLIGGGFPIDPSGHGTHTASIAAGNFVFNDAEVLGNARGTASGIAPKAHLAIYQSGGGKVTMLKAIEQAIHDNVDVISMSIGDFSSTRFYRNSIIIGSFAASLNGIVPCAAAPNYGPTTNFIDNDAPWIITVGASSTDRRIMATVILGDGREFEGESAYQPSNYDSPQLPLVSVFRCLGNNFYYIDVKGKIVLCAANGNTTQSGQNILDAGGKAMIIIGNKGNTTYAQPHVLPVSYITAYAGNELIDYAFTLNPTAAILFKGTQFGARPSPAVATISGRGPSDNNGGIIKPDVIAPGVNILAAWPFEIGLNHTGTELTFNFKTGTSMATPHVAGLAALLKRNHPTWSFAAIQSAMMTTARDKDLDNNPIEDQANGKKASVFAMGSGYINPIAANDPGLIYQAQITDYISYLCGMGFDDKQVAAITKGNINTNCSTIVTTKVEDLNYPSIQVSLSKVFASKTVHRTVTNVGDVGTSYTVSFDEPKGVNILVSPVVLTFNDVWDKKSFNVTLSYKTIPMPAGEISEGQLSWDSGKYLARIPIAVVFA